MKTVEITNFSCGNRYKDEILAVDNIRYFSKKFLNVKNSLMTGTSTLTRIIKI